MTRSENQCLTGDLRDSLHGGLDGMQKLLYLKIVKVNAIGKE